MDAHAVSDTPARNSLGTRGFPFLFCSASPLPGFVRQRQTNPAMTSDKLQQELATLREWKATPAQKLREALQLLDKAAQALDVIEGEAQDLREAKPDAWHMRILDALDEMPTDQIGPYLEAGKQQAGIDHGYTSPEYESMNLLAHAITSPVTTYR